MTGREEKGANDLFFVCSLIEYLARKTNNKCSDIVKSLGKDEIGKLYELADVYHSDNIDRVSDDLIKKHYITKGSFDNISTCTYNIPTHWDIGKVYKRLILGVEKAKGINRIHALTEVFTSFIEKYIEDYNGSFYYENPDYILECYLSGKIL